MNRSQSPVQGMRSFLLIMLGQLLSATGSLLNGFALSIWIYGRTGSVTEFALVSVFSALPGILIAPIAGALVDRYDRRRTILLCESGLALSTLCLFLLFTAGWLELWQIYLLSAINSCILAFLLPSYNVIIPLLVAKERLGQANGIAQANRAITQIAPPLLGGVLVPLIGLHSILLIDLVSCIFPILIILAVRIPPVPGADTSAPAQPLRDAVGQGWRYLNARPHLMALMVLFALTNFLMGCINMLITPLVLSFATPAALGAVLGAGGLGMLGGGILLGIWGGPRRRMWGVMGGMGLSGLSMILAGLQPALPLLIACAFGGFFFLTISRGCTQVIWQTKVAPAIQGRVFAISIMVEMLSIPLSTALAGPLADKVFTPLLLPAGALAGSVGRVIGVGPGRGIALMFILSGALTILTLALGALYPRLRLLDDELPDALLSAKRTAIERLSD